MTREIEQEKIWKNNDPLGGERHSHPAYGQISASRASSGKSNLYFAEFAVNNSIRLRINRSEFTRALSKDWTHECEQYIEVEMSEHQWARLISSLNVGEGVPCTVNQVMGKQMPLIPDPESRRGQFSSEVSETMQDAFKELEVLRVLIGESKGSIHAKKEMTDRLDKARQEIEKNIPYVQKQFNKHVEQTIEQAKTEINAYGNSVLMRAGINHLAPGVEGNPILAIENKAKTI